LVKQQELLIDATGSIKMSIWNEDIDKIKEGSKVMIKNGYVSEWQGEMQLGTGKYGSMEVVESSEDLGEKEVKEDDFDEEAPEEETTEKPEEEEIEY
jgi:ssDNA-binding replication factor A large subunit